jgi:hypothetical protein
MERDSPSTSQWKPYTLQTVRMRLMAKKSKEEIVALSMKKYWPAAWNELQTHCCCLQYRYY